MAESPLQNGRITIAKWQNHHCKMAESPLHFFDGWRGNGSWWEGFQKKFR